MKRRSMRRILRKSITALWACSTFIDAGHSQTLVEGRPIESRPPEKADDRPEFPEQTRAPYRATAPFKVTTLIDNLPAPWSLAFLPDGKILLTERLPGRMRILDPKAASRYS